MLSLFGVTVVVYFMKILSGSGKNRIMLLKITSPRQNFVVAKCGIKSNWFDFHQYGAKFYKLLFARFICAEYLRDSSLPQLLRARKTKSCSIIGY